MHTYKVLVHQLQWAEFVVDAENSDEAEEIALGMTWEDAERVGSTDDTLEVVWSERIDDENEGDDEDYE